MLTRSDFFCLFTNKLKPRDYTVITGQHIYQYKNAEIEITYKGWQLFQCSIRY